jgi:superfamily II DNA/RNA helicase
LPGDTPTRDEICLEYLDRLPYPPYPAQEQALYAWFGAEEGVMVCAPTGTGKTLIAEGAIYEALRNNKVVYYTTPLIALTDQKFREIQEAVVRWGYQPDDVGLVTGNRRVNPNARVLVVVAEILFNRLLTRDEFPFENVAAVVMDEFHSFVDPERGIVWEFSLALMPPHVRLMLLSATVGNAVEFLGWLRASHGRNLELVQSDHRRVPLRFHWVPDRFLTEQLQEMARGEGDARRVPALVFCFNRDECWSVAEELKGKDMLLEGQQKLILAEIEKLDWSKGAGPKLKALLLRGVGVHHAGILPRYRRIVERLFQRKLLSICVCTETLAAGINLPAKSVVMPSLVKGPPGKMKLIDPSSAHQIFGRAGRPQYDAEGHVFVLPHEDDVRILKWKEKFDQIPEDTKDPGLLQARKALKKKQPTRSPGRAYWNEAQFEKLRTAPPRHLTSQGGVPWRILADMLRVSPDLAPVRELVRRRLQPPKQLEEADVHLDRMLRALHTAGIVRLEPPPPDDSLASPKDAKAEPAPEPAPAAPSQFARLILTALNEQREAAGQRAAAELPSETAPAAPRYRPLFAHPTERLADFLQFRGVDPLYALFLLELMPQADQAERIQLFESVLELPMSLMRYVRVPPPDRFPPGTLAREFLDMEIVSRGLITAQDLYPEFDPKLPPEERKYAPSLAEKARMLFEAKYASPERVRVGGVWVAGDVLFFAGKFHNYIGSRDLSKQEGLIHRHLLRMVLLLDEFTRLTPPGLDPEEWRNELRTICDELTEACRQADPETTDLALAQAEGKVVAKPGVAASPTTAAPDVAADELVDDFGAGVLGDE